MRIIVTAIVLTASPADRLTAQCPDGAPPPCRVATGPPRVPLDANALAVMPFRTSGPSAEAAWLGEGMVDLLSVALDGFADWRTVHPRTVLARVAGPGPDLAAAAGAARAAGASAMVVGSAVAVGPQLRLHAELYDAVRVTRLAVVDASGALERPGPLVDSIAVGLAQERLRRHPVAGSRPPHEYATTSPQALRIYVAAEREARRGNFREAAESLQRAVALDSAFGLAYYRLYALSAFAGAPPGGGRFDLPRMVRAGLSRSAGLPQRQRDLLATIDLQQRGLVADALRRADELGRRYPDDAEAAYIEGESYYHLGAFVGEPQGRALAAFERGVQLDPGLLENYNHAIELRCIAGDSAAAFALLQRALAQAPAYGIARAIELTLRVGFRGEDPRRVLRTLGPIDTGVVFTRALLEALRSFDAEPAKAIAVADTIAAALTGPEQSRAIRSQFLLARAKYRLVQGRQAAADSLILEARLLDPSGAATVTTAVLRSLLIGDAAAARVAARTLAESRDDAARFGGVMTAVWAAALDGDTILAGSLLRRVLPAELFPEYQAALLTGLAGLAALQRGDSAQARALLPAVLAVIPYTVLTVSGGARGDPADRIAVLLAQLERAAGDLGSARRRLEFLSYLTGLTLHRAEAEELKGQIAEQQGDRAAAIRAYRNFIALWNRADTELQPRVQAAREAVARLERN